MFSRIREILKFAIQYAALTHCTFEYVGDFVVCNGPSMEPTLYSKNILLTERITTRFHKTNRGDIIIAVSPLNPNQHICKRIVGIPGDKIITKTLPKVDKVDSENVIEISEDCIPRGYVWIEGDNSLNSSDSRSYGAIPIGLIKSRVICRLWPFSDVRML